MSLATRCPACQTVFRVVQDQLRVSEGWVRCGRCAEVFNALEHMVEVARPAPPPLGPAQESTPPEAQQPAQQAFQHPAAASTAEPSMHDTPDLGDEPRAASAAFEEAGIEGGAGDAAIHDPQPLPPPPTPHDEAHGPHHEVLPPGVVAAHEEQAPFIAAEIDGDEASRPPDVEQDAAVPTQSHDADPLAAFGSTSGAAGDGTLASLLGVRPGGEARDAAAADSDSAPSTVADTEPADSRIRRDADGGAGGQARAGEEPLPSFLRQAERAERWRRPGVRGAMAVVLLIGLAGLVLQVGVTYRDLIAARWPASRVWLESVCEGLGCRIEQPRWLDAVVVDSTGLTRIEGTPTYRLQVVLRNRSTMTLALPAIDLSLTDTQGRLVARRALSTRELGSSATALAPQGELALQATLAVGAAGERAERGAAPGPAVAGYTIEVFYP